MVKKVIGITKVGIAIIAVMNAISLWGNVLQRRGDDTTRNTREAQTPPFVINSLPPTDIRYIAIGDSYTCGTGIKPEQAWPVTLTKALRAKGIPVGLAANLAVNGWTTNDAITRELPRYESLKPAFTTVMIGVNDTYRATTVDQFRSQFKELLDRVQKALPDKSYVVLLTIPDFSVTPTGKMFAQRNDAVQKIQLFNRVIQEEGAKRHLPVVDVYPLSLEMGKQENLRAEDGLHPSAREHDLWMEQVLPIAQKMLQK